MTGLTFHPGVAVGIPPDKLEIIRRQFETLTPWHSLLGGIERLFAIRLHYLPPRDVVSKREGRVTRVRSFSMRRSIDAPQSRRFSFDQFPAG